MERDFGQGGDAMMTSHPRYHESQMNSYKSINSHKPWKYLCMRQLPIKIINNSYLSLLTNIMPDRRKGRVMQSPRKWESYMTQYPSDGNQTCTLHPLLTVTRQLRNLINMVQSHVHTKMTITELFNLTISNLLS